MCLFVVFQGEIIFLKVIVNNTNIGISISRCMSKSLTFLSQKFFFYF